MPDERPPEVGFEVRVGPEPVASAPLPETPFRIAILGDFSGRAARGIAEVDRKLADRPVHRVDRDNLDELIARIAPEVRLPTDPPTSIRFSSLEDFHPDRLFERLPLFQRLLETRQRLADPATSAATVRELLEGERPVSRENQDVGPTAVPENLLEQILEGASPVGLDVSAAVSGDLGGLVRRIVGPYLVREDDSRVPELLKKVDLAAGSLMRALLHYPAVRSLEASWRSLDFLARRVETSNQLQLHLIDVSKDELAADQRPDTKIEAGGLYKLLVESTVGTPGGVPWALIIGDYAFGPQPDDLLLLARLGALADLAGAPWIAAAQPRLAGIDSFANAPDPADWRREENPVWNAVRREPQAISLGLALPRFLIRLPYGRESENCDLFAFEEMSVPPAHEDYLWGNPAYACALLLAESFSAQGWSFRPGLKLDIGRLPLHLHNIDGETRAVPCAETLLTERAAGLLLDMGLMPLASMKESDAVRLVRFQSLSDPPAALAGMWLGRDV